MAKRKLNKKVTLIGSAVFVFLALAVIGVILHLSRDPEKFIKDGDTAMKTADEAIDEEIKAEQYGKAERSYQKAHSLARDDLLRIEMLFKLADIYIKTDQWNKVLGCWSTIVRIDPENVKARFGRLKYVYIMADSGLGRFWQDVESQTSELIEVVEDANLLAEDTAKWEPFGMWETEAGGQRMGPYLYLLRGRAALEVATRGALTDPDASLARAVDDLENVQELEPNNPQIYWYLAQAATTKGDILAQRGDLEQRKKSLEQAEELLKRAVEVASSDARAHINLLTMKLMLAQSSPDASERQEQIQSLESEYLLLVERFDSDAEAFLALARFYRRLGSKNLDKAIETVEKAVELDKENVAYAINAANWYYQKFSIYGQKTRLYEAIEVAKNALTLPHAQDKPGPRQWANRRNRILLYSFLANCYIEQVLEPSEVRTKEERQEWLTNAEQAVHEIEQLVGSGEEPQIIRWRGMLDLAKGNRNSAIKKLYAAYEQLKAAGSQNAQLSYALAKVFVDTAEVGAVREFLVTALGAGIATNKPEAILDYAELLLKLNAPARVISYINVFEERFRPNERSQTLRIKAYIVIGPARFLETEKGLKFALKEGEKELARAGFERAEEELANSPQPDDPNTIKLNVELVWAKIRQARRIVARKQIEDSSTIIFGGVLDTTEKEGEEGSVQVTTAELASYRDALGELVGKLLQIEPNYVEENFVAAVSINYIAENKIEQAKDIVNRFLEYFPNNATVLFHKQRLSEPEPGKISQQGRKEIEEQALSNITDPIRRAANLGAFYHRNNEPNKAAEEFKKVLKIEALSGTSQVGTGIKGLTFDQTEEIADLQRIAVSYLFEAALGAKDWHLASAISELARQENIDNCEGNFFAARLAMAKEDYKDAMVRVDECLRQRPVFSPGFLLRSNINDALGNEHASIEDAKRAASWNPLDGTVAKGLVLVLDRRNQRLGDNVSSDQIIETTDALNRALKTNPGDLELLSFYAEYISPTEPSRALAIRQHLQERAPSIRNARLLGRLAMRIALQETDAERKEALFALAHSSFEQARRINQHDKGMLYDYAEYYRARDMEKEAEQLLLESEDQKLLWSHYFRGGQFGQARRILERLYKESAKDSDVVKGLLLVAQRTGDREAVKKYSEELLLLKDSVENNLIQIQTFLRIGLVKEAHRKLQSFKERYPDEPRALLLEAWLAMRQGQLKEALELTNRNLETDQDNAVAWRLRGKINLWMANFDQAIIDLKTSKSLLDNPDTRIALAKAYLRAGREEDAITELKATIDNPQAPAGSRLRLEQVYLRLGRLDALKKFYAETLEKFPDSVLWYNRVAEFTIKIKDYSSAEQLFKQAWQKGKKNSLDDATAFDGYLRALLLGAGAPNAKDWNPKKLDKVFEVARRELDSDFAPLAYWAMAQAKLKLGDNADATQYSRKALDIAGKKEMYVSTILKRMLSLLGAEEVRKICNEKLQEDHDSPAANLIMFNLTKIGGEYNKAIGYVDRCLRIMGTDSPKRVDYIVQKAEVLTLAYTKTADSSYLNRAVATYESLLAEMPNNTDILNNLAYMLVESNQRLEEALGYAKRAYETMPNNAGFLDTYAYVLYKNGRFTEAAEFLQIALQQYEQNEISAPADVYEHLGMVKEGLGAKDEALLAYKQALEIGADQLLKATKERIAAAIERISQEDEN